MPSSSTVIRALQVGLLTVAIVTIGYRVTTEQTDWVDITPQRSYDVTLRMTLDGTGGPVDVTSYIPPSTPRQKIAERARRSGPFGLEVKSDSTGRQAQWSAGAVDGTQRLTYAFRAWPKGIEYPLNDTLERPARSDIPDRFTPYLTATEAIQAGHPFLRTLYDRVAPDTSRLVPLVRALYDHVASLESAPFKGVTDAVTAAKLKEASCNGKSRLLVALARQAHIPSRLVGGLILENGTKSTTHQWAELRIDGHWVPFDALNGHFARLPAHYLTLYHGDEFLLGHTPNINFQYTFDIQSAWTSHSEMEAATAADPASTYGVWAPFVDAGLSLDLLMILLLLPVGATVVVFFRNVVGLETYGTFLPALIAAACLSTGLTWGLAAFFAVTLTVAVLHVPLEQWGLLHTPRMAILMAFVVIQLLLMTAVGVHLGWFNLSYMILFPVVILTSAAERFASHLTEDGPKKAAKVSSMTALVITGSYSVMGLPALGLSFLAFPELLLVVIAINLWLGRWVGIRLTEYARFRWLLDRPQTSYAPETR